MAQENKTYPQFFLRLAFAITMLSAVADRLGFWGDNAAWGNWGNFEKYTRQLTFFLPEILSTFSAYTATILEILFSMMLLLGIKTKIAAFGTGILLFIFAISMTFALGIKTPFDYSVWVGCAAAFLLASQEKFSWSFDEIFKNN